MVFRHVDKSVESVNNSLFSDCILLTSRYPLGYAEPFMVKGFIALWRPKWGAIFFKKLTN